MVHVFVLIKINVYYSKRAVNIIICDNNYLIQYLSNKKYQIK